MKAEIIYTAGKSYALRGKKFMQDRMETVHDPATIKKAQQTSGFSVRVLEDKKIRRVKKVEPVNAAPVEETDDDAEGDADAE